MIAAENPQPSLRVVLPGHPDNDSAIDVISQSMLQQRDQAPANRNTFIYFAWDSKERGPPAKQMNTRFNMKWILPTPSTCWPKATEFSSTTNS
jgi:hypothetical protein